MKTLIVLVALLPIMIYNPEIRLNYTNYSPNYPTLFNVMGTLYDSPQGDLYLIRQYTNTTDPRSQVVEQTYQAMDIRIFNTSELTWSKPLIFMQNYTLDTFLGERSFCIDNNQRFWVLSVKYPDLLDNPVANCSLWMEAWDLNQFDDAYHPPSLSIERKWPEFPINASFTPTIQFDEIRNTTWVFYSEYSLDDPVFDRQITSPFVHCVAFYLNNFTWGPSFAINSTQSKYFLHRWYDDAFQQFNFHLDGRVEYYLPGILTKNVERYSATPDAIISGRIMENWTKEPACLLPQDDGYVANALYEENRILMLSEYDHDLWMQTYDTSGEDANGIPASNLTRITIDFAWNGGRLFRSQMQYFISSTDGRFFQPTDSTLVHWEQIGMSPYVESQAVLLN